MDILVALFLLIILIIDFGKLKKEDKKTSYVYVALVLMIAAVWLLSRFELMKMSPLEVGIEAFKPVTDWLETILK